MTNLPFRLNFFKQVEAFYEVRKWDKQYSEMEHEKLKEHDMGKTLIPDDNLDRVTNISWPSWNFEKKFLRWTYLGHKHLGSGIKPDYLVNEDFLTDINSSKTEVTLIGAKYVLENLIMRGYADGKMEREPKDGPLQVRINERGLYLGSLLEHNYKFKECTTFDYAELNKQFTYLVPKLSKKIGHFCLYILSFLIIIYSLSLLSLNLASIMGLLDDLKLLFHSFPYKYLLTIAILLFPVILFILSIFLILPNQEDRVARLLNLTKTFCRVKPPEVENKE